MSTRLDTPDAPHQAAPTPERDMPQLGLAAMLVVIGAYTFYDATTLRVGFGDPVGPRIFPYAIGAVTVVLGLMLVLATLRGDIPQAEGGEDVDLRHPSDWVTVLKLVGVLLFTVLTISFIGWAVSGALLFVGSAWALGSRTLVRDVIVGFVLSVSSWYFFHEVLGVILPAGILDGVL
ncbi:MAG TPA: tripartite tricarboxylate transporter TctB family protein [Nocardioides sp.]|nr:tripartite tricarboxylate transporter TctB family protein [Nocardioides sp.]